MEAKKYSSYAEIELELEILKVERALNRKRIVLAIEKTKDSLSLINVLSGFFRDYRTVRSNSWGMILKIVVPLIMNWFTKRKRGN